MHRVDGASLHGAEQFAGRHDLVGEEQFDHHFAIGSLVEGIDERLGDELAQRCAGIGLHAPADWFLGQDRRRGKRGSGSGAGGNAGLW